VCARRSLPISSTITTATGSQLGENVDRVGSDPERFYLPAYIGARGWFGLRLDRGRVNWTEVGNLLELSYCLTAPKRLAQQVQDHRLP
jgi:hypothetical protein